MSALTITHTHETGTLIDGTSRGDGSAPALKTNGWRWGRSISAWYVPQTRDHIAQGWKINQTAEALRAAGFDVEIEIDNTPRATVDVELGKQARQAGRVDALTAQADRKHADAETRWAAADRAHDVLPPAGSRSRSATTAKDATAAPSTAPTPRWARPSPQTPTPAKPTAASAKPPPAPQPETVRSPPETGSRPCPPTSEASNATT